MYDYEEKLIEGLEKCETLEDYKSYAEYTTYQWIQSLNLSKNMETLLIETIGAKKYMQLCKEASNMELRRCDWFKEKIGD